MRLADLIASLQAGGDPNQAVLQAFQPGQTPGFPNMSPNIPDIPPPGPSPEGPVGPPVGPPPAPVGPPPAPPPEPVPPPPASTTPTGTPTPVTNPIPATATPAALKSPPDLSNMYIELMKKNQNAAALDSGLTLMAAGLSNNLATRAALINASHSGSSGRGAGNITSADIINLQKQEQANRDMLLRRSMLGGLAKQYGLSPEAATALETSGKLDEVIVHREKENLTLVEHADGSKAFYDHRTGKKIVDVSGPKETTQVIEGPEGQELRRTDPKGGFGKVGEPAGLKPNIEIVDTPTGKMVVNKNDKSLIGTIVGGEKNEYDIVERADKSKFKMYKRDGRIEELSPAIKAGDIPTTNTNELAEINKVRAANGEKLWTLEDLIAAKKPQGTTVNVAADGTQLPNPERGYDYIRDENRKPRIFPDGKPRLYAIEGGGPAVDAAADAAKKAAAESKIDKAAAKDKIQQVFKANNVGRAIDGAIEESYKTGATGALSHIARSLPIGGQSWTTLDSDLETATAAMAFDALKQMRDASPTGASGLGQVTDVEQRMLKSVIANLNPHQDPDKLRDKLFRVKVAMHLLAEDNFGGDQVKFIEALDKGVAEAKAAEQTRRGVTDPNSFGIRPRGQL